MMYQIPNEGDYAYFKNVGQQNRIANLERENERLRNGETVKKMQDRLERQASRMKRQEARHRRTILQVKKDAEKRIKLWQTAAYDAYEDQLKAEARAEAAEQENVELKAEVKALRAALEDALNQNIVLLHRLGLNHENSHIPSSMDPIGSPSPSAMKKKKKYNSRKKTENKRGAQPGHDHHPRKKIEPNQPPIIHTEIPEGIDQGDWYMTSSFKEKLSVRAKIILEVTPHLFPIWRNRENGQKKTAPIPDGLKDEINYEPTTAALVMMLTQFGNMAARKAKKILHEATDGVLDLSHGWIAGLPHKFAVRSTEDVNAIFKELFDADYLHVDSTVTKNDGRHEAITVACNPDIQAAYYVHSEKKGDAAAQLLPCANGLGWEGIIISDREAAFLKLAALHQLCLQHLLRELQEIAEMELDLNWHNQMIDLLHELIHASHEWGDGPPEDQVKEWEERYDEILQLGRNEYCKHPPTKYFLKGHNLRMTFKEMKDMVLLFLHHPEIPCSNSCAERMLRTHKRSLHQKVTFRSGESIDDWCATMTVVMTRYLRGENIFHTFEEVMARPRPLKTG